MATVGISTSASTSPRPLRCYLWFARPRIRHSLQGAVGLRRLVVASDRQKFTQKSDEKWYCTSGYGTSRPPQVPGSTFSPIRVRDKRNMIDGPGPLEKDQGVASKATLSNNSHLWREKGESIFKTVTASKLLQRLKEDSHSLRANCLTCSGTTFKEFPGAVTELNENFLHEDAHTLGSQLEPSSFSKEVDRSNVNCTEQPKSASPPRPELPKEVKTLIGTLQNESLLKKYPKEQVTLNGGAHGADHEFINMTSIKQRDSESVLNQGRQKHQKILDHIFRKVLVVNTISAAREVVHMLTTKYKDLVHACDTEVAKIDVKTETPVGHGQLICFSIYSGPKADFGNGKSCIWVDVLDGERNIILEFAPFFEDNSIKKVWHNYSFDFHIIQNYGIKLSGFHADTMHLARLWDSSRRMDGGYSLEALSSDVRVMDRQQSSMDTGLTLMKDDDGVLIGKISMKDIFGKKKLKKDGSEGKIITIAPVEELQRGERVSWISYSAWDSIKTLELYGCLNEKLMKMPWIFNGMRKGTMFNFYEEYWQPFGIVLVEMEAAGMLIDRGHLSEIEKVALVEQQAAGEKFRKWAATYCHDAIYMNVGSDTQVRQLFFGGIANMKDHNEFLPVSKTFKVPNIDNVIEEGKKSPSKTRSITLHKIGDFMHAEIFTPSGWPSVSADALKTFSGKVSADEIYLPDDTAMSDGDILEQVSSPEAEESKMPNGYGTAYAAFGEGREGMNACRAIAALCEICSIDSLISNFILPLQGDSISGSKGRIHCSLNINTETGRLSARRPNLQNPPALEKDRYKIRQAFIAGPGKSLIVADYGQLELRILAHLASCKSMLDAFKAGGDFHSRTAMNMYSYIHEAVENKEVLLEWHPEPGQEKPPVPLLKDAFGAERRKAKMLNFSIAYGKTPAGLSRDWKVSLKEAKETVRLWYNDRQEVLEWQEARKKDAVERQCVHTLLGRARRFPSVANASYYQRGHIERAAINTPVQGSAADVAMCAMLEITRNRRLQDLNWKLLLQVHDEVILEGPSESADEAKAIVVECMSKPFYGHNILKVDLAVDAKCAQNWYAAK